MIHRKMMFNESPARHNPPRAPTPVRADLPEDALQTALPIGSDGVIRKAN